MCAILTFYLRLSCRRLGYQPEDSDSASIDEANAGYGFFSPHSWWPLIMAGSIMMVGYGLVFARWLLLVGVLGLIISVVGLVFEYTPIEYDEASNHDA